MRIPLNTRSRLISFTLIRSPLQRSIRTADFETLAVNCAVRLQLLSTTLQNSELVTVQKVAEMTATALSVDLVLPSADTQVVEVELIKH